MAHSLCMSKHSTTKILSLVQCQYKRLCHQLQVTQTTLYKKREQEIRYNNLAPMLTKPLKILFDADKAEAIAERTVVRFQDAFQPVGKMIDALRNQGLSIANALDPYLKEKMFHGYVKDLNIKAYENFYTLWVS